MTKLPPVLFENDDLIALDKPAGMLSIPDRTQSSVSLKDLLIEKYGNIFTVHRLDRDTSGAIVFAKHEQSHKDLSAQFEMRETEKIYQGIVIGRPTMAMDTIDEPIAEHPAKNGTMIINQKGKPSITSYAVLEQFHGYAYLQFQIYTGRTHQIRVHMKHIGHPIVCDDLYGDGKALLLSSFKKKFKLSKDVEEERPLLSRLALHAAKLTIKLSSGEPLLLEAPLPKDLRATLEQLGKWNK